MNRLYKLYSPHEDLENRNAALTFMIAQYAQIHNSHGKIKRISEFLFNVSNMTVSRSCHSYTVSDPLNSPFDVLLSILILELSN